MNLKTIVSANVLAWGLLALSFGFILKGNYQKVEPNYQPYVSGYYELIHKYCQDPSLYNSSNFYKIESTTLEENDDTIAYCQVQNIGYTIVVNTRFWNQLSDPDRRQLFYHELAHCVIYKDHVPDEDNYMYPYFVRLSYNDYLPQVEKDINDKCNPK